MLVVDKEKASAPPANAPGPLAEKASESSTLRGSETGEASGEKKTATLENGEGAARSPEATV